jgi:dienelactone hydrolase
MGRARAVLRAHVGPAPRPVPPEPELLESVECAGYVREKVSYNSAAGDRVRAYVCVPTAGRGRMPAVFCHHQHAGDFALGKSEPVGLVGDPDQAYAAELAQEGFVTITPDAIGFEERNWRGGDNVTWFELASRLVQGRTLLADCLADISVGLDLLASRDDVDPDRIGFIGHSYGGRAALWAPAFDDRIRASVSNCGCIPYRLSLTSDTGVQAEYVLPGFAAEHDLEDLFPAYADRTALLISAGTEDRWSRGAAEVHEGARRVLGERAELAVHETAHRFTPGMRRVAYDFLHQHLGA